MVVTFVIAAIVGIAIGLFSGMLGVGGGTVMVPIFRLAFGMSPMGATATSLFAIIPTSLSGVVQHVRRKTCMPKLGIALGVGGACTSPLGVWLAQLSPGWLVMVAAALVIGYSSITMVLKALGEQATSTEDSPVDMPRLESRDMLQAVLIGVAAGVASGYVGLGGGFIMVPLMVSFLNMPMRLASGTSLIAVMILALPATVLQCILGNIDYLAGAAIACGSIPGALVGARLVSIVPERALRLTFAAFLGVAAILLVVNELGLLGA